MSGQLMVCEICGSHTPEPGSWFAVAEVGSRMEVLPWTESLRQRSDCRHACCGDHVQQLVFAAATHDLGAPVAPLNRRAGGWNPSALAPPSEDRTEHSIQSVLDAIDVALAGESAPDEEDGVPFDA